MTERYYTVKQGDSLWGIANHFGLTVEQLAARNHLVGKQKNILHIGQKILLPGEATASQDLDLKLRVKITALSGKPLANLKLKLTHDGQTKEAQTDGSGWLHDLHIQDHVKGLAIAFENYEKKWQTLFTEERMPLGEKILHISTMTELFTGATYRKEGTQRITTKQARADIKATTPQPQPIGSPRKPMPDVVAQPIVMETRTEGGQPTTIVAATFTGDNLHLSVGNQKYRQAIIDMAKKHGFTPHAVAAIINAEAGKDKEGTWIENSAAGGSSARGLGQFLPGAWYEYIATEGTLGNAKALEMGRVKTLLAMDGGLYKVDKEGDKPAPVSGALSKEVLGWRDNGGYSIEAILVYAKRNLVALKRAGIDATALPPDEQVKIAYILHHEGASGGIEYLMGKIYDIRPEEKIRTRLARQFATKADNGIAKADALAKRFDGDYAKAYYYFLANHADKMVTVKQFMQHKEGFNERTAFDVLKSVAALTIAMPKEIATKPAATPSAAKPAPVPTEELPTQSVGGAPTWHNPLINCKIRVGGYADSESNPASARNKSLFHPTADGSGRGRPHTGIDLAAELGTPIISVANGVIYCSYDSKTDYGNIVVIEVNINDMSPKQKAYAVSAGGITHDTIYFLYAHLNKLAFSKFPGTRKIVKAAAGQVLGETGNSGNAKKMTKVGAGIEPEFGAHLHFEVRRSNSLKKGEGKLFDPFPFIEGCQ